MACGAFYPRKSEMQVSALQVAPDDIHHIGSPETVAAFVSVIPRHFQLLEMVACAAVIVACLRCAGTVVFGKLLLHVMEHEARCVPANSGRQLIGMRTLVFRQFHSSEHEGLL